MSTVACSYRAYSWGFPRHVTKNVLLTHGFTSHPYSQGKSDGCPETGSRVPSKEQAVV